jgi:putative ABC transport system permease protein
MAGSFRLAVRSISFYKKPVLNQVLIIALLSAVITGSLLTGRSVKESLKKTASEKLGNTGILISSGKRFFSPGLIQRIKQNSQVECTGLLEANGYCQVLNTQKGALSVRIFGINQDFFTFQGFDTLHIKPGEVAVNKRLADFLGVKNGDDIIIRFNEISAIPSDAPFSPAKNSGTSIVLKIGSILKPNTTGNFSLSISQVAPMNVFINMSDMEDIPGDDLKLNRLLIKKSNTNSLSQLSHILRKSLSLSDIGLKLRRVNNTGQSELISDRIFIDEAIINEVHNVLPNSAPLITYLGNKFEAGSRSTPYSFISALPPSLYPDISGGNSMIINKWMAQDLSAGVGDTLRMHWYAPDSLNKLVEKSGRFIIHRVVDIKDIWSDSLLMPDFPGIAGKESCSDWDAGVPVKMHDIRTKDEDYWKRYRGTPKAFISYDKGRELWGNYFGPATAIRFPDGVTENDIKARLDGNIDPEKTGFTLTDISGESLKAADSGVDFGTLFLSLGFFLIIASLVLLSFAASSYFDSKRKHINTLFALGFKNRWIEKMLFFESGLIGLTGCFIGTLAGYLVNILITAALNSVWTGAVQTDTLRSFFNLIPLSSGFLITFLTILLLMIFKIKRYLNRLNNRNMEIFNVHSRPKNLFLLSVSLIITIILFVLSATTHDEQLLFSFSGGTMLLVTIILSWRQFYISRFNKSFYGIKTRRQLSHSYYSFYPSGAVTPILFIAAGIFTVFITGANRMDFNEKQTRRSGGTGGYLLWCENAIGVKEDLNSEPGKKALGLNTDELADMHFVQIKRSPGNDASCLNLNHITAPPLLGIDPESFISGNSFTFSKALKSESIKNFWEYLDLPAVNNTIYGIADQTVLDWGLKIKIGDTLTLRAENGQPLKIIIAGGLQSSVFQGNVLIGLKHFTRYYPSVSGSQILLIDGNRALTDTYKSSLSDRLGISGTSIEKTSDRLISFYQVTNTYLSVFGVFGSLGMIIGIAGLGFILLRNYNQRKNEFALMLATGFNVKMIRGMILSEQLLILFAGVSAGVVSAMAATLPSIKNNPDLPWLYLSLMIICMVITGFLALVLSVRTVTKNALIACLKKE